jgi:hypothetical protein
MLNRQKKLESRESGIVVVQFKPLRKINYDDQKVFVSFVSPGEEPC